LAQIIERVEARYEAHEVVFGKVYEWHPAYVTASTITACQCGAHLGGFVHDLQEREGRLPDRLTHPWFYDAQARADQRLRDEAAYPRSSPWRYDDVTADEA
jgi:hypothetical protein